MPGMSFNDGEVRRRAVELGLMAHEDDRLSHADRTKAKVSLLSNRHPEVLLGEPLVIRTEVLFQGEVIGAHTIQIPAPRSPKP